MFGRHQLKTPCSFVLRPSPASFYRCHCCVSVDVTGARAVLQLSNRVFDGAVFNMRIWLVPVGVTARTVGASGKWERDLLIGWRSRVAVEAGDGRPVWFIVRCRMGVVAHLRPGRGRRVAAFTRLVCYEVSARFADSRWPRAAVTGRASPSS